MVRNQAAGPSFGVNTSSHPDEIPALVFADSRGNIIDYPELSMAGAAAMEIRPLRPEELIPLPPGSELFILPGRLPVGIDPLTGQPAPLAENPYDGAAGIQAVAAFMAPAHTAIYTAAFVKAQDSVPLLPLFAYTAVGWYQGKFWVAALRSDADRRQDYDQFDQDTIRQMTRQALETGRNNRLIRHLGHCCLVYGCPAARNYFLHRWEAPLPTSPACNASCLGCISLQPSGCCPATQERIDFVPSVEEIVEIGVEHLLRAENAVISFGQGCEGEPLLQADTIEAAIRAIRRRTPAGTVNLNTNGSRPDAVGRLADAGLDSIRISMNSARRDFHHRYYRPRGFDFVDVLESISAMKARGRFVSLNYFILPGFTDDPAEFEALCNLIDQRKPDLIQLRNLNMDPHWYLQGVDFVPSGAPLGITRWLASLRRRFPGLGFGYFNPALGKRG